MRLVSWGSSSFTRARRGASRLRSSSSSRPAGTPEWLGSASRARSPWGVWRSVSSARGGPYRILPLPYRRHFKEGM